MEHYLSETERAIYFTDYTAEARRQKFVSIVRGTIIAIVLMGAFVASGLLETQRIEVMQQTSAEATMTALGI